jgi:Uma2 family endonuclease
MTLMPVMPRESRDWTVADLDLLPDDGLQYELLDGLLLVSPAPVLLHQAIVGSLYLDLRGACPPELKVYFAPVDWRPDDRTSLQPDLLVVRRTDRGVENIRKPLLLAVEVLSPSTRRKDLVLKRSKYEECAVASYWIVDPEEPSILVCELRDGHYVETGRARGAESLSVELPFPVTIAPTALVAD